VSSLLQEDMADYLRKLDLLNKAKELNPAGAINDNNGVIVFPW
jgi:hypothetical protein